MKIFWVSTVFLLVLGGAFLTVRTVRHHLRIMRTQDTIGCVVVALDRSLGRTPLAQYNAVEETMRLFPSTRRNGAQILDAWGNPLSIQIREIDRSIETEIISAGPDGRLGTGDDLVRKVRLEAEPS